MRALGLLFLGACGFRGPAAATSGDGPLGPPDAARDDGSALGDVPRSIDVPLSVDAPPPIDALLGPWLPGRAYRKAIQVNLGGSTSLTDFPVAILESADPDLAARALADGSDLVVTASDAVTVLATELVSYAATGRLELWVRVPSLAPTTTLYLYYGGPPALSSPAATWSSLFAGVWHLSNATGAHDSTTHAHDLAAAGAGAEPGAAVGVAGGARAFDGVMSQLSTPDPADGSLDFGTGSFSYSIWVDEVAAIGQYDQPFWKGGTSSGQPGYCMMLGTGAWGSKVHDGTLFVDGNFGNEPTFVGQWTQLVAVVDRAAGKLRSYTNGVAQPAISLGALGSLASPDSLNFGGPTLFHGALDEVRIYATILDPVWIAAEYANLRTAGFVQIGPQQP